MSVATYRPHFEKIPDVGNEAACMKVAAPETQFCAEEIMVGCVERRGHFSYEEGKYFPA